MRKILLLIVVLLAAASFFALTLNFGAGGDFEKDATGTYENTSIYTQIDISWFTAVLNIGDYGFSEKEFVPLNPPELSVGFNFRIPFWVLYAKTQLTVPVTDLANLLEDSDTLGNLTLHTRLSLGFKYNPFFVEAGASAVLTPFAGENSEWPNGVLPFVLLGLTF